jgi:type I restriction enzyme, S subunit
VSTWPVLQLRRVFRVVNGGTPTSDPMNWGGDLAWATPVDLAKVNGGVLSATERTLTELGLATGSRAVAKGSLVLSTRAPIGYVAEASVPMAFNQGCRGLVPADAADSRYFRYQLLVATTRLSAAGQGSTFVELSGDALAAMPIVVPPIGRQRAIADFLDVETARINALIAKKHRLIELLDEWAIADLESRLDPAEYSAPQLGERRRLGTVCRFLGGTQPPKDEFVYEARYGYIRLLQIRDFASDDNEVFIRESASTRRCRADDVMIGRYGGLGETESLFSIHTGKSGAYNVALIKCQPDLTKIDPRFLYWELQQRRLKSEISAGSARSVQSGFQKQDLKNLVIWVPVLAEQRRLAKIIDDQMQLARSTQQRLSRQIGLLVEHRQALITAAVTGEFEIPGVAA